MIRSKYYLVLFLFLLSCSVLFSQNKGGIKGFVTDSATGESIPYATIQIIDAKQGIYSNVNGFYLLQNIPFGTHTLQVSAVGYNKYTRIIQIRKEEPILATVKLIQSPIELQGVTKTAERIKEVYETNISVQAITQEELQLIPIAIEQDVFKALKIIPGISKTSDLTSQFFVRGGAGDQNMILLDNMMLYNPFHALGLFSIFNGDAVKVSEVLTGGFGPEFGGRLSSVINITTREGNKNKFSGRVNLGLLSGQALLEGPSYDGSFILSFRKSYFDRVLKKYFGKELPLSFYDLMGKITYDVGEDGKFFATGLLSSDDIINPSPTDPNFSWYNSAFGFSFINTFGDRFIVNVSFSRSFFNAWMDPKYKEKNEKSESKVSDIFFNSKVELYLPSNDIFSIGFTYILPDMEYSLLNSSGYYIHQFGTVADANLWFKYKLVPSKNLIVELGLRNNIAYILDQPDYVLEPRMSFKYQIENNLALKGSVGRYHQNMITTANEDDVIPLFETWIPIDLPFHPERSDHYILGLDGVFSDKMNFSFQGYYKRFANLLGYNLNKIDRFDADFSAGTGTSYGFEALIKYQSERLYGWLTYTLSWTDKTIENLTYPPRYDKRHNLNLIIATKLPENIDLTVNWEIGSGLPFTQIVSNFDRLELINLLSGNYSSENGKMYSVLGNKNGARLPMYHRMDLNISKVFNIFDQSKLKLTVDAVNVYNHKNIFYYNRESSSNINMLPFLLSFSIGLEF